MGVAEQAVRAYYEAQREPKFDPTELRLSETGDCKRKRVLKALGAPVTHPISEDSLRVMETGNVWEQWLVERIQESVLRSWPQQEVEAPHGAAGHVDLVVLTDDWQKVMIEIKATSQYNKYLPDERHVLQVQAYLHFWGRQRGFTSAQLVYIRRENGAGPEVYEVVYDPAAGVQIEAELAEIRGLVTNSQLPPIPAGNEPGRFPCSWGKVGAQSYCSYYGHCYGQEGESVGA